MWLTEEGVSAHVEAEMRRVPGEWVGMWPDGVCKMFVNMCVCKKERESLGGGVLYQQGVRGHEKERGVSVALWLLECLPFLSPHFSACMHLLSSPRFFNSAVTGSSVG